MIRRPARRWFSVTLAALAALLSCRSVRETPREPTPPPRTMQPTFIDYVESDAFDALFEAALRNQDPAVVIRTNHAKPDWGGRLNAWLAAWNMGGSVEGRTARGQAPLPNVTIDGDSIREFRLLVNDLMGRVEGLARAGPAWFAEERTRSRRVALLRPYNLRFHMVGDGTIQLVFFNGRYAQHYPEFVRALVEAETPEAEPWSRNFECSLCKYFRQAAAEKARLASRASER